MNIKFSTLVWIILLFETAAWGQNYHGLGFVPIRIPDSLVETQLPPRLRTQQLPPKFDWRSVDGFNYITPVKNQYSCNSCWAFAAVAQFESAVRIYSQLPFLPIDLSEQELVSCDTNYAGCDGGNFPFYYFANPGVVDESCFPYDSTQTVAVPCGNICPNANAHRKYRMAVSYIDINWDLNTLKQAVYHCPMFLGVMAYSSMTTLGTVSSDYIYLPDTSDPADTPIGGHAMLCIGWDDSARCLIFKNSWGESWGDSGFIKISYDAFDLGFPKTMWFKPDSYKVYIFPVETLYTKLVQNWESNGMVVRTDTSFIPIAPQDTVEIVSPKYFSDDGKFYAVESCLWTKDLIDTALFGSADGTTLRVAVNAPITVNWSCVETVVVATECLSDSTVVAYPNPFSPPTQKLNISFNLCHPGIVDVKIFDAGYNLVKNVVSGEKYDEGAVMVAWDGTRQTGEVAAPGVYFVVVESSGGERGIAKVVLRRR